MQPGERNGQPREPQGRLPQTQGEHIARLIRDRLPEEAQRRFFSQVSANIRIDSLGRTLSPLRPPAALPIREDALPTGETRPLRYTVVVPASLAVAQGDRSEIPAAGAANYASVQGTDLEIDGLVDLPVEEFPEVAGSVILEGTEGRRVRAACRILTDLRIVLDPATLGEATRAMPRTIQEIQDNPEIIPDALYAFATR